MLPSIVAAVLLRAAGRPDRGADRRRADAGPAATALRFVCQDPLGARATNQRRLYHRRGRVGGNRLAGVPLAQPVCLVVGKCRTDKTS